MPWRVVLLLLFAGSSPHAFGTPTQLIRPDDPWRVIPLLGEPPAGWTAPAFDDSRWTLSPAGFCVGYSGFLQAVSSYPSLSGLDYIRGLAVRRPFVVDDPARVKSLALRIEYEDGLLVWLNGEEILRVGFPPGPVPAWNATPATHAAGEATVFDLGAALPKLAAGTNCIALQVFDASPFGGSTFAWPELRANFVRGPLLQNVSSNSATLVWRTLLPQAGSVEVRAVDRNDPPVVLGVDPANEQAVTIDGLIPDTRYEYRVTTGEGPQSALAEPAVFRTLKASGPIDFVVVGDTGTETLGQLAITAALARQQPDLILHVGDIVYPSFVAGRVDLRHFSVFEPSLRKTPWFYTFGNHDVYAGEEAYLEAFRLPRNSLSGTENFYSFDHGDAHFVSLFLPWWGLSQIGVVNADGSRSAQYAWLTNDLARSTKPWKIVFFHQPPRSSGPHRFDDYDLDGKLDVVQMQEQLVPLLCRYGVQLMVNGHDHGWERIAPTNGLHGLITGGGGAFLYEAVARDPASAQFSSRFHFSRIRIRGSELRAEAVDTNGLVFDRFSIRIDAPREDLPAFRRESKPGSTSAPVTNGDGNVTGETFDLPGYGIGAVSRGSANLGRLVAATDVFGVHLGLRDLMLWPGQTVALFIAAPGKEGVMELSGVGELRQHPLRRLKLRFPSDMPSFVCLLGDEFADDTLPDFIRMGTSAPLGQGVFRLDAGLSPVPGARVRQFNRSPEGIPAFDEQNADFAIVSLPWSELGSFSTNGSLHASALVVTPVTVDAGTSLIVDDGFLGASRGVDGADGSVILEPVTVHLAERTDNDVDGDGLSAADEAALGTDPEKGDTDGDGLPDGWEVRFGLDPLRGNDADGPSGDPDGDGYSNAEEFASQTDPSDATPVLRVAGEIRLGVIHISWRAMIGRTYEIESAERLPGAFTPVTIPDNPRIATGIQESAAIPRSGNAEWFRVRERR